MKGKVHKISKEKYIGDDGYVRLTISHLPPEDQKLAKDMSNSPYIHEHRLVVAKILDRPLRRNEIVHHKDGNRPNNELENLELMTLNQHSKDKFITLKSNGKCPVCNHAGKIQEFVNWFEREFGK